MPFMLNRARRRVGKLLRHSYTRVPQMDALDAPNPPASPALDAYGDPEMVQGAPLAGQACLFDDNESIATRTDHGTLLINIPHLYVRWDDPLQVDDVVQNVTDQRGSVLVASAIADGDMTATSPDGIAFRIVRLREVQFP